MDKKSVLTDISVLGFYGYIGDISVFINYSKFKNIFNLYIKIILKVYKMVISIRFEKKTLQFIFYKKKTLKFILNDLYKTIH